MAYTVEDFFEIFSEDYKDRDVSAERYAHWCQIMDDFPELIGNEKLLALIKKQKDNILASDTYYKLKVIRNWREEDKIPRSHFWWWIDEI